MTEKEEMWVKEYVRKNTVLTEKGYKCPYPAVYAYPAAGQVTMQFGRGGFTSRNACWRCWLNSTLKSPGVRLQRKQR